MSRTLVLLALLLSACGRQRPGAVTPFGLELCVENATVGYGHVIARAGPTRFDVQPGRVVCKRVSATGGTNLVAPTFSGGAAGPLAFRRRLPGTSGCWHWRLENARVSDLYPCD